MHIDISAAARAYGLDSPPRIHFEEGGEEKTGSPAWFDGNDGQIHVWATTPELGDDYTRERITRVLDLGDADLSNEDELRFIIAHELYHAAAYQSPIGAFIGQVETYLYSSGLIDHDYSPGEVAADAAAATVWPLVEIDGRKGEGPTEPTTDDAMQQFSIYAARDRIAQLLNLPTLDDIIGAQQG